MRDADLDPAGDSKPGLRIAMLVRAMPLHHLGGMELYAETMRQGLTRLGHTVTTITTPWPGGDEQYIEDQWGAMYGVGSGPSRAYSKSWDESSVRMLLALHERNRFDVIASHGKAAYPYLRARSALASRQRLPVVIISHGTFAGELHARIMHFRHDPLGLAKCVLRGIPLWREDARWIPRAQHLTVQSQAELHIVRRTYPLGNLPISVVPNGVDIQALSAARGQRAAMRERLDIGDDTCMIVAVAALEQRKGHRYLLDALSCTHVKAFPRNICLVLAGDGSLREPLGKQADRQGISRQIRFLGPVPRGEVPALLSAADLFVLPSLDEGLPLALLEAMGSGLPVIASDVGSVASVVRDGETGLLVAPGDSRALARAFASLLRDPKLARTLGAAAQQLVWSGHDQQTMLRRHEQVLISAARSGAGAAGAVKAEVRQVHGAAGER